MDDNPHFFKFDLDRAIRDQVVAFLGDSPLLPLQRRVGPKESGIYVLHHKGQQVYVGKASKETTKSDRSLRTRLDEHVRKIEKRQNISLDEMAVRYITFESEWWVFAAEYVLIAYFNPEWNYSGFGSKVPGIGRPGTDRVSSWDAQFPER